MNTSKLPKQLGRITYPSGLSDNLIDFTGVDRRVADPTCSVCLRDIAHLASIPDDSYSSAEPAHLLCAIFCMFRYPRIFIEERFVR